MSDELELTGAYDQYLEDVANEWYGTPLDDGLPTPVPTGMKLVEIELPVYSHDGMGCGLEDRGITDRYEAMAYGYQEALEQIAFILEQMGPMYTLEEGTDK